MSEEPQKKSGYTPYEALGLVWEIGVAIALPTVLFALLGRWLDNRFGTSPWFLGICLLLSLVIVGFIVIRKGKKIADKL